MFGLSRSTRVFSVLSFCLASMISACGTEYETAMDSAKDKVLYSKIQSSAGPLSYVCVFEDQEEQTRFEFKYIDGSQEGTFSYTYSPIGDPARVEGLIRLRQISSTWSLRTFSGNNESTTVELSTPSIPKKGAAYAKISIRVNEKTYEPYQFLECTRAR